jgi:hypothetical protein
MMDTAGRRGSNCATTRGRRCLRANRRLRGSYGSGRLHVGAAERVSGRSGGRDSESQAIGSCGVIRVLVTTSRLQRLVRGILRVCGSPAPSGADGTRRGSAARQPTKSRDRRVAEAARKGVPIAWSVFISMTIAR